MSALGVEEMLRRYDGVVPLSSIQGTLALDLSRQPGPTLTLPCAPTAGVVDIEEPLRRRVEQWAQRYAQAAVEIVGGDRPASQLVRWTSRAPRRSSRRETIRLTPDGLRPSSSAAFA